MCAHAAGAASGDGRTHPLADTIRALRPNAEQLSAPAQPAPPAPLDSTPCTLVDTPEALAALAAALRDAEGGAIAVDLEAHSYRSFQGFVCLMQVSTRREDYLVDTLALRGASWRAECEHCVDAAALTSMPLILAQGTSARRWRRCFRTRAS